MIRMKKHILFLFIFTYFTAQSFSQDIDTTHESYATALASLEELKELLAIPNDANFPKDIAQNVKWCESKFQEYNFTTTQLPTETVPLLLAEYNNKVKRAPTFLFYFHIDGQPVDPSFWFQENPYQAVLKKQVEAEGWVDIPWSNFQAESIDPDWRIFARSSSDDKSPFVMFLAALKTLKSLNKDLPYNLKIILDFEEEKGSPRLAKAVLEYKEALKADQLIIFDGPKHLSNRPTIAFGARGITTMSLKVHGPTFPLHSGHYGNYAPNPALRLAQLLSSMKDSNGRVLIPGYYEGIQLTDEIKEIMAEVPDVQREIMAKIGVGEMDLVGSNYQESLQYPSLNIRGMASAWVGDEARTIVPATALAEIDLRLVVESDGDRLKKLVRDHIERQGYIILDRKPTSRERVKHQKIIEIKERGVTDAFRTAFDAPIGIWVFESINKTFEEKPIRLRTMGGTLPTSPFINTLDVPAVIIPLVNSDNNQHSPNENLRVGNYFDGVKLIYGLLSSPFK